MKIQSQEIRYCWTIELSEKRFRWFLPVLNRTVGRFSFKWFLVGFSFRPSQLRVNIPEWQHVEIQWAWNGSRPIYYQSMSWMSSILLLILKFQCVSKRIEE